MFAACLFVLRALYLTGVATIRASDLANGTASWGIAKALRVVALPPVFRMRSHESIETFVPYFVWAVLDGKEYMPNAVTPPLLKL